MQSVIQNSFLHEMLGAQQDGMNFTAQWTKQQHDVMHVVLRTLSHRRLLPAAFCASMRRCFP